MGGGAGFRVATSSTVAIAGRGMWLPPSPPAVLCDYCANVSANHPVCSLFVQDDVLLALFWGWKLQYQIQGYSTDAEEARGLSNFMALVRAQRGGLNLEQLLKLLWTTYYTQRPCACRCGWE